MPEFYIIKDKEIINTIIADSEDIAREISDEEVLLVAPEKAYQIGWIKDETLNKWYNPVQPYNGWILDEYKDWKPPIEKPDDNYDWDETNEVWFEVEETD